MVATARTPPHGLQRAALDARVASTPSMLDERGLPADGPVLIDVDGLGLSESQDALNAARDVLEQCEETGRNAVLVGRIGSEGEPRRVSVARAAQIWSLYEDHRPELWIEFPRLPADELDPIASPPDGPPEVPTSPTGEARPAEWLAEWELRTLRRLIGVRVAQSSTRKVIVNLTYKCNNYCTFCAVGNRLYEHGDHQFHRETLESYRAKGVDLVDFDGGEPTIYPKLLKIIGYARELGYRQVNITTNGRTMAYPHIARKLLGSGLTSLLISCHGPTAEIHEEQVQAKGSFRQTVKGIRNAVLLKPPWMDFGVNITLTSTNWQTLPEYYALMARLGVRKINVQFLTPFGRAEEDLVPDPGDIAPVLKELIDRYASRIRTYLINVPFCYFEGYEGHVMGDVLKLQRNMVFVTRERVNLFEYLAGTRERAERCEDCVFSVACEGFYSFAETFD